jgi:hypothetical protein
MKFERYRLLEIFDQERMVDEKAGVYEYTLSTGKLIFILTISEMENSVHIQITQSHLFKPIADFELHRISRIVCDEKRLGFVNLLFCRDVKVDPSFYIEDAPDPFLTVNVKPSLHIGYNFEQ